MKITIELTNNEVKAIKEYLKQFADDGERIGKDQIKQEIQGMISGCMQTGSMGDYYRMYCMNAENNN
jgi:hypothetical protein